MKRLVVDGWGKIVGKQSERIVVKEKGQTLHHEAVDDLRQVVVSGGGSIRNVEVRFPTLMTRAFSMSLAPISLRYRGKSGCTSWLVSPMATFMENNIASSLFRTFKPDVLGQH